MWDLLGIEPDTRFAIVRFVKWDAWHDTQLVGEFTLDQKRTLIQRLQAHIRVFFSSEAELPAALEPYRIHIPIEQMHHVQAAAALFVGESATMASKSVCLTTQHRLKPLAKQMPTSGVDSSKQKRKIQKIHYSLIGVRQKWPTMGQK